MTRAAVYLRVSTSDQSVDVQRPDLERLAATRGLEIAATYEETVSGAAKQRPELDAVLAAAHRGEFRVVLVWALDRLGRSMHATIATVLELDRLGVQVISAREPWLDTSGPVRSLLLAIFAWVAQQERERLVERTKAGVERARRAGKQIGRRRRYVDVERARELRAAGKSLRAVANELGVGAATLQRALAGDPKGSPDPAVVSG